MALGATARNVVALVVGQATAWTLTGALAGIAVAWRRARFPGSRLYCVNQFRQRARDIAGGFDSGGMGPRA